MNARTRLPVLGLLAALGLVLLAGVAAAQEGEPRGDEVAGEVTAEVEFPDEATKECFEIIEAGGSVDDCEQAPNPVVPEINELIWGGLFFLVVLGVLVKFAFPALREGVQRREEQIRAELEAAEAARKEAEAEAAEYRERLAEARTEAARIIEEARQGADQVRRDLIARAEEEAAQIRTRAEEDIRLAQERALADLREQVGELSIDLAEKIVGHSLDRETQRQLIESFISEVGGR